MLASAPLIARTLGVKPATIRKWAQRRKITKHGTRSQPLYDVAEVNATRREFQTCNSFD